MTYTLILNHFVHFAPNTASLFCADQRSLQDLWIFIVTVIEEVYEGYLGRLQLFAFRDMNRQRYTHHTTHNGLAKR